MTNSPGATISRSRPVRSSAAPSAPSAARPRPWVQIVAALDLPVLALVSPAYLFPTQLPRSLAIGGLALGLVAWLAARLLPASRRWANPLNLPILLLLVMAFPSLYASADMTQSLPKLTGLAFGFMLCAGLTALLQAQPGRLWTYARLYALGAVPLAAIGLVGTDWSGKFPYLDAIYSRLPRLIHSVPNYIANQGIHPNELAGVLLLFIPLLLALAALSFRPAPGPRLPAPLSGSYPRSSVPIRVPFPGIWFAVSLLTLGTLVLTQSRSALFGLAVALSLWAAYRFRWFRPLLLLALLAVPLLVWQIGPDRLSTAFFGNAETTSVVGNLSFAGRVEVWQRAIYMLQDFPFTGVGLNMFGRVAQVLYPFFLISPDTLVPHAHNLWLQVGVDFGLPGLVAYIGLLTVFFMTTGGALRSPSPRTRALAAGLLFGMLAHQVYGLTDAVALGARPDFVFWIVLALGTALGTPGRANIDALAVTPQPEGG